MARLVTAKPALSFFGHRRLFQRFVDNLIRPRTLYRVHKCCQANPQSPQILSRAASVQHTLLGLLTAILALKRPYLALDLWVQRSPHEIGLSPAVWAGDRLDARLLNR